MWRNQGEGLVFLLLYLFEVNEVLWFTYVFKIECRKVVVNSRWNAFIELFMQFFALWIQPCLVHQLPCLMVLFNAIHSFDHQLYSKMRRKRSIKTHCLRWPTSLIESMQINSRKMDDVNVANIC